MSAPTPCAEALRRSRILDWDGTAAHARELQSALAGAVDPRDGFPASLSRVAGLVARTADDGSVRAAAVLLDAGSLVVMGQHAAPVIPPHGDGQGLPAFRVLPALLAALSGLPQPPDLLFVEGHGTAHPAGLGVAAHLGVATGLPTIGVAHEVLYGSGPRPHETRGAYTALRDPARRQVGWLLRSLPGSAPVVVSPAHRVALASAADLVMRFTAGDRLPEPLRIARGLVRPEAPTVPPGGARPPARSPTPES